jgi:hypothetical protein
MKVLSSSRRHLSLKLKLFLHRNTFFYPECYEVVSETRLKRLKLKFGKKKKSGLPFPSEPL